MYCPSCNSYNDDSSRFCANCGAPLVKQQTEQPNTGSFEAPPQGGYAPQQPYQAPEQQGYQPPYQQTGCQPTYAAPPAEPTKPITMATPVVAIILNVVFFNIVGLILAVLSLVNFNNYSSEKLRGGFELAETYKRKSKTLATAADVLAILFILLIVAVVVAAVVFGVLSLSGSGAPEIRIEDYNLPQDFFGMIG